MKIAALALAALLTLSACADPDRVPVLETQRVTIEVPASLQQSCFIPNPPPRGVPQSRVATYILDLNEALENCAARHGTLVGVINDYQRRVEAANSVEE